MPPAAPVDADNADNRIQRRRGEGSPLPPVRSGMDRSSEGTRGSPRLCPRRIAAPRHDVNREPRRTAAGIRWEVAVEAVGWPLTLHFVQLGAGLAIVNAICRLPPGVVSRPVPALPSTHYWLLGKPRTPATEDLARMIRSTVSHRRRARR